MDVTNQNRLQNWKSPRVCAKKMLPAVFGSYSAWRFENPTAQWDCRRLLDIATCKEQHTPISTAAFLHHIAVIALSPRFLFFSQQLDVKADASWPKVDMRVKRNRAPLLVYGGEKSLVHPLLLLLPLVLPNAGVAERGLRECFGDVATSENAHQPSQDGMTTFAMVCIIAVKTVCSAVRHELLTLITHLFLQLSVWLCRHI